ncbi:MULTISPECIES: hypothetical protein [Streptomycetaceae]|uniref:hypothetical protein n=1 Tax=Streptomycetaceae TaxID=2062 RepID=UPI00093DDAB3|nr:hypothetical protein [Streptomyces sp. CB02056]OKI07767.1 hypothetical protein AMK13_14690 [Streptomyces sp. CB02056]
MLSQETPAPTPSRSRRLHLRVTAGGLGSLATTVDLGLGWRLVRAGMGAPQAGAICFGLLAVPVLVALAAVLWSADRLEASPRS